MAQQDVQAAEELKDARKLRELFKGRFSEDEAVELLREHGNLGDAVDFVLNGDPAEVRKLINDRNAALVDNLRRETDYVQRALVEGLEASVHLFACKPCDHYWWRKVPARKEVSRCRRCRTKYEPVPRHEEWGLAEFVCVCGNVFWGSGWMNHIKSPCYKCGFLASPRQILPPTRPHDQRNMRGRHSCTGGNCYNRTKVPQFSSKASDRQSERERERGTDKDDPICPHEQSVRRQRVLFPSEVHVSTGSTVNSFMSQGELAEDYEDLLSLPGVPELEED